MSVVGGRSICGGAVWMQIMFAWVDSKTRYFYAYLMYAWGEETDPNCPTKDTLGGCTYKSSKKYDASAIAIVY